VSQTGENTGIIVVNEIPDRTNMIRQLLRKRQGFAHQTRTALTERVVEAFNVSGLTTGFINGLMPFGGQNAGIGLQKVGLANGPLPVVRWERIPQILGGLSIARPNGTPDNQARFGIDGQPQPDLVAFVSDK
jgi:hypothetical protein